MKILNNGTSKNIDVQVNSVVVKSDNFTVSIQHQENVPLVTGDNITVYHTPEANESGLYLRGTVQDVQLEFIIATFV